MNQLFEDIHIGGHPDETAGTSSSRHSKNSAAVRFRKEDLDNLADYLTMLDNQARKRGKILRRLLHLHAYVGKLHVATWSREDVVDDIVTKVQDAQRLFAEELKRTQADQSFHEVNR